MNEAADWRIGVLEERRLANLLNFEQLRNGNERRAKEWGGTKSLSFHGNEMAGECGEACNVIKKIERRHHDMPGGIERPTGASCLRRSWLSPRCKSSIGKITLRLGGIRDE